MLLKRKCSLKNNIEKLDKRMQNLANRIGSKVGDSLKVLKEKEPAFNERREESPARIEKLEEIFSNLSMVFSSTKTIEKTPIKIGKITQVTKNKGATSNSNKEDLKMISIHTDFVEVIKDPTCKNELFKLVPRSIIIKNLYAKSLNNSKCLIEELGNKMKTLRSLHYA